MRSSLLAAALALGALACSVESNGNGGVNGDGTSCVVRDSYANIPAGEATHGVDPADGAWFVLNAEVDDDPLNLLEVSLWTGNGAFAASAIATGSYPLTGDDASYDACGVCVALFGDVENEASSQLLAATGGTVEITSISGSLTGALTDVVLEQVDKDTLEPVEDGCRTTIASASFSAPITEDDDGDAP